MKGCIFGKNISPYIFFNYRGVCSLGSLSKSELYAWDKPYLQV